MVKVADAIAHAMYFLCQLFVHQQVMELEAILVVGQQNLEAHEVQEVQEVVDSVDQKERQDYQRRYGLADMENWYHLLVRSQV